MSFLSSRKTLRLMLAVTVALWMAGAGCMLGCENMVSAAANNRMSSATLADVVVAGDACASVHSHDCCAKRAAKPISNKSSASTDVAGTDAALRFGASSSMMDGCPLAVNATAALSKARYDQSSVHVAARASSVAIPNSLEQTIALSPLPRLPNRGHTYLRCCVFLI